MVWADEQLLPQPRWPGIHNLVLHDLLNYMGLLRATGATAAPPLAQGGLAARPSPWGWQAAHTAGLLGGRPGRRRRDPRPELAPLQLQGTARQP